MRVLTEILLLLATSVTVLAAPKNGKSDQEKPGSVIEIDPQGRPPRGRGEETLIWRDDAGWHLRSYASGKNRARVSGTIRIIDGKVSRVNGLGGLETPKGKGKKQATADAGMVSRGNTLIQFQLKMVGGGEDGFNFQVTPTTTAVEFTILVDGLDHPEKVRIGASGQRAPGASFVLPNTPPAN